MSATGTIEAILFKESKAGKTYGKVSIDGSEYLVFGKTLESLRRVSEGSTVEFSAKPSDNGDGQIITFLKGTGFDASKGSAPGTLSHALGSVGGLDKTGRPKFTPSQGRGNDQHIQLSIFYGYAKDLVAHGIIKAPVGGPVAVVDLVSTTAKELMRRFEQDSGISPPPVTQEVTVAENPL